MTRIRILLCCIALHSALNAQGSSLLKLWYDTPAATWNEALPLGNGWIGAMMFGDPRAEQIQLNHTTVWAGSPYTNENPAALAALPKVRALVFQGKFDDAQALANAAFIAPNAQGMPFQPVGSITLHFPGHEHYANYRRELDLAHAAATVTYALNGVRFKREAFTSLAHRILVVRITADVPGSVAFTATMNSPVASTIVTTHDATISLSGIARAHEGIPGAVRYTALTHVRAVGGKTFVSDTGITVVNADTAVVYCAIGSSFNNYLDAGGDAGARADSLISAALQVPAAEEEQLHRHAYHRLFDRVALDLGVTASAQLPTDQRIERFAAGDDPQLAALYFQYGRYLLISCSEPGGQPATLQGIWNDLVRPPWDSKYTININTEMNYWPSEVTNLSELNGPLVEMVRDLSVTGRRTARLMYGARGWVAHHNTDLWRATGVVDKGFYGLWPLGGAWLTQHLWEKYAYSGDKKYLRSIYPVMKEAARFICDVLVEDPVHHWLVLCPSMSPENAPSVHPKASISAGCTMDNQIVFDLLTRTSSAARVLGTDAEFAAEVTSIVKRLPPMQIGKWGQLQEWIEDWDTPGDRHRHPSHLYGVFPSGQISPYRTPELFEAARTSLIHRGDASTGWSMGWKVNLWARFQDGDHALKLITDQLRLIRRDSIDVNGRNVGGGGTYPNMFDAHPPFQIDGNFGCTSGIAEMLMQSHDGAIHILPALPARWKKGSMKGLCARGGFVVDVAWNNGKADAITITSRIGGICRIRTSDTLRGANGLLLRKVHGTNPNPFYAVPTVQAPLNASKSRVIPSQLRPVTMYEFATRPGRTYRLLAQ